MEEEGKRKRGRPRNEKAKTNRHSVRLTDEEESMLKHYMFGEAGTDENVSDVLRKALRLMYFRDKYNI